MGNTQIRKKVKILLEIEQLNITEYTLSPTHKIKNIGKKKTIS